MKPSTRIFPWLVLFFGVTSACVGTLATPVPTSQPTPPPAPTSTPKPTITPYPTPTRGATLTPEPTFTAVSVKVTQIFDRKGERFTFTAEDGQELVAYFYIASKPNQPVVVMMHQFGTDQAQWAQTDLIPWMQNYLRADGSSAYAEGNLPAMPEGLSFNVLTFDFRGHGESGGAKVDSLTDEVKRGYILDAKAAYAFARTMPQVNPDKIIGLGTSMGADAVVDTCRDGCVGAFAISPGNYIGVEWFGAATQVIDQGKYVVCVYGEKDNTSPINCKSVPFGRYYKLLPYTNRKHGIDFLIPRKMEPEFGLNLLDFLTLVSQ